MTSYTIVVACGPAIAHLTRPLLIADLLRQQGHHIHLAVNDDPWVEIARRQGYTDITIMPSIVSGDALRRGSLALPLESVATAVEADIAVLKTVRPRLVIVDWRPSMRLAAALLDIPLVAIVNAHVTRHYTAPLVAPERHSLTRLLGQSLANRLMAWVSPLYFRAWARPFQRVARKYGHHGWTDFRDYLTGDLTLYPDLPSLAPARPGSGIYCGPLIHYPLPVDPLPPLRDPVLYISFGSDTLSKEGDARAFVNVIGDWPGSVVMTQSWTDGPWPEHWIQGGYVDPFVITQQGYRIAWIYHGGNGSSYQLLQQWIETPALCAGAIILPANVEQQWNALKLQTLGIAHLVCPMYRLHTEPRLTAAIADLQQRVLPPPPDLIAVEVRSFLNAPERAMQVIAPWLSAPVVEC